MTSLLEKGKEFKWS
jgi:hypothetical protein